MQTLRRVDWERATLEAIADGGLGAVHIDELATRLGVTKGSFYWHYGSRDELIDATLTRWRDEALGYLQQIRRLPPTRGQEVLARAMFREPVEIRVEIALVANVDDERVTPFVEAVAGQRMQLFGMWFGKGALAANAMYVGYQHTVRVDPALRPRSAEVITSAWNAIS